jgi:hypothetical protein
MSMKWASALLLFSPAQLFLLAQLRAPRAYLRGHDLILENAQGQLKSLGAGFNPVPISEDMFLLIRGAQMGYGEESSCESPGSKNRVVVYDIIANKESILFDKPLSGRIIGLHATCVYEHADLSPGPFCTSSVPATLRQVALRLSICRRASSDMFRARWMFS